MTTMYTKETVSCPENLEINRSVHELNATGEYDKMKKG